MLDMKNMFSSTEPLKKTIVGKNIESNQTTLPMDALVPYDGQPFELYEGERKEKMIDSIRENGIYNPLLVRDLENGYYQILSGHNRWNCAKEVGLTEIPCTILKGLTDDEALIIVLDSNIQQRSISEMPITKQAHIYALDVAVNKRQGRRSDLIKQIENNLELLENSSSALSLEDEKTDTIADVGNKHGVSRATITRLIRIDALDETIKPRIDTGVIGVLAGVQLSYLTNAEQKIIADLLEEYEYGISESKAKLLRRLSKNKELNSKTILQILDGSYNKTSTSLKPKKGGQRKALKLSAEMVEKYYDEDVADETIIDDINNGLSLFLAVRDMFADDENSEEMITVILSLLKNKRNEGELC